MTNPRAGQATRLAWIRVLSLSVAVTGLSASCRQRSFAPSEIDNHVPFAHATPGFLLGVATSAHQIEGGNQNDWTDWEVSNYPDGRPHVKGHATATIAADSWQKWPQDVEAIQILGANLYRFGVEWSRLEPSEGAWNSAAVANYRKQLLALRSARPQAIQAMLNLYHFTLPRWVAQKGGWEWAGAVPAFAAFASRVAHEFGDVVDLWCTLNEPNVYATKSYMSGEWPPGVREPRRAADVMATLLKAHAAATKAIRAADVIDADGDGKATRIGLAHNVRVFDPANAFDPLDRLVARYSDAFYNRAIPDAVRDGRIRISLPTVVSIDEPAADLKGTFDWLGLNYYTRDVLRSRVARRWFGKRKENDDSTNTVAGDSSAAATRARAGAPYEVVVEPGTPVTDLGWPIYPEGLLRVLEEFADYGWPILVSETGLADVSGTVRPGFMRSHALAIDEALRAGIPVIGYVHWSLMDNFEWSHGYDGRFGLFTIDFARDPLLVRRPTPAVETFRSFARQLGLKPTD